MLRFGGAKRRFVLAAAKHRCGACAAQKRAADPIASRSPNTFGVNDVVGFNLFFPQHKRKTHLTCHEYRVLEHWTAACCHHRDQSGDTYRTACLNTWLISSAAHVLGFFAEKTESDGTRLEVTPLEAPWSNGKTERAGKDWKEDCYTMTQDCPEAQTWTDFEEDCDAVNQARASKNYDSGYSVYQRVFGRSAPQMEDAILECGGADLEVVRGQQAGELTQEVSMTMRRVALQASLALDHKPRWKRASHHATKHDEVSHMEANPWVLATRSECSQQTKRCLLVSWCGHQRHVKCARSQVRRLHDDNKAPHKHVTLSI